MSTPEKINFKTATTRYENSETTTEIVSKRRISLHLDYFYSNIFLDVGNAKNRGNSSEKIVQMPRDAPRRDVFGHGLEIFVAHRGGFKIDFELVHFQS